MATIKSLLRLGRTRPTVLSEVFHPKSPEVNYMTEKIQFWAGLVIALIGAALMFEGSVLGENTTGIAIVVGIVGIGLIATSKKQLLK